MLRKSLTHSAWMSVKEISEVVSENVICSSKGAIGKRQATISGKARREIALFSLSY